jgi:hypothetical protein
MHARRAGCRRGAPDRQPVLIDAWRAAVADTAYGGPDCQPAVCSSTVRLPPPCPTCPACCDSPWLLRTYSLWADAQGSMQDSLRQTASGDLANFQLGFNDAFGGGLELERLLGGTHGGGKGARWGWTFGAFRSDFNTRWQIDLPTRFLLDHERVPITVVTTGINYHWPLPKWDVFLGPVIGGAFFNSGTYPDDSRGAGTFRVRFGNRFTCGANLGLDATVLRKSRRYWRRVHLWRQPRSRCYPWKMLGRDHRPGVPQACRQRGLHPRQRRSADREARIRLSLLGVDPDPHRGFDTRKRHPTLRHESVRDSRKQSSADAYPELSSARVRTLRRVAPSILNRRSSRRSR